MKSLSDLKTMCAERGTSLTRICEEVGINRSLLCRWEKREPKTIQLYKKIYDRIEAIPVNRHRSNKASV